METYKDIDEFIKTAFPQEYEKILREPASPIQRFIDSADSGFESDLAAIIKGGKEKADQ
jgi:hypothetical protein